MAKVRKQNLSSMLTAAKKIHKGRRMIQASNISSVRDTPASRQRKLKMAKQGAKLSVQGTMELNRVKRLTK